MSFHIEAIAAARVAARQAASARRVAEAARILAQVSCPHEDLAMVHYGGDWYYRICQCCGLQIHDWCEAYKIMPADRGSIPSVSTEVGNATRFGPMYESADHWRKVSSCEESP